MLQTVDPRYTSWLSLVNVLAKLKVINVGQRAHRYTAMSTMLTAHKPKPHWIPLAVVSLSVDYIEIIPLSRAR